MKAQSKKGIFPVIVLCFSLLAMSCGLTPPVKTPGTSPPAGSSGSVVCVVSVATSTPTPPKTKKPKPSPIPSHTPAPRPTIHPGPGMTPPPFSPDALSGLEIVRIIDDDTIEVKLNGKLYMVEYPGAGLAETVRLIKGKDFSSGE